ncbi:regulator of G-protein signaling 7-like isoform X3 [Lineus longissimus]|uniref:regulator of G-protein signaling 7-like isoform X3 n=1 Tax=Lineus longissimus TaxID=88925 RepID=UPI00315C7B02
MVVYRLVGNMAHRYSKKNEGVSSGGTTGGSNGQQPHSLKEEENPHNLVYKKTPSWAEEQKKMEQIVERMQDEQSGVPVKTVKNFISKVPSVFTGTELVTWMMKNLDVEDQTEALHLAHLMASHGYFFPIEDHVLTVKNDNTYYRFQTPCFWPSRCGEPENTDYAVYLCKRTMQNKQRLELADYEAENLARLQKMFSRKWELIFMQAEAQAKVDKKRDKLERKVLDSQERAFWDVHRPVPGSVNTAEVDIKKSLTSFSFQPGCVNTTEVDIKKACKMNKPLKTTKPSYQVPGGRISPSVSEADLRNPADSMRKDELLDKVEASRQNLERRRVKVSKVAECFISYFEQYAEFDPFLTPVEPSNPWLTESVDFWEQEKNLKDVPQRRVKRWAFSVFELLKDPAGRDQFSKFLDKEFSGENLNKYSWTRTSNSFHYKEEGCYVNMSSHPERNRFWEACQELKSVSQSNVHKKVQEIYSAFLAPGAYDPVNVDSRVAEIVKKRVHNNPDRYCFAEAEEHIFNLMKSDSYSRYLRSDMYKEFLGGTKKKQTRSIIPKLPSLSIGGP